MLHPGKGLLLCGIGLGLILWAAACRPAQPADPPVSPSPDTQSPTAVVPESFPPGPVLALAALPGNEFLAGVGPIGDAETGFEYRVYRGRENNWEQIDWPVEAVPRSLHVDDTGRLWFAVPQSQAVFGPGQAWGLMRSTNGGRSWEQSLEGLDDPYVVDVALSPAIGDDHTLAAVTWYAGVFYSNDDGLSWQALAGPEESEILPSGGPSPYDLAVALSPDFRNPSSTGTFAPQGTLLASFSWRLQSWDTAAGAWQTVPITVETRVQDFDPPSARLTAGAIAFSPDFARDATIYVYSGYAGLYRSHDAGQSWEAVGGYRLPVLDPLSGQYQMAAVSTQELYLLLSPPTIASPESGQGEESLVLYRSLNGGQTWERLIDSPMPGGVSAFLAIRDETGRTWLHLGGSRGGVSSFPAGDLDWD